MRRRNIIAIILALGLLIAALLWIWGVRQAAVTRPEISIGVLRYQPWAGTGPGLLVRVGITNVGHRIIRYNKVNFDMDAKVRVESPSGWTTRDNEPFNGGLLLQDSLRPGSSTTAAICLPKGTLRWQVQYTVEVGSLREVVSSRMPPKLGRYLRPLSDRLLSNKGHLQYVQSGVFECPHNQQHSADGSQPFRSLAIPASAAAGSPR
jgi:hypothetical protein